MISAIKNVIRKVTGSNPFVSTQGKTPNVLSNTQKMFLRWNAARLNISLEESRKRYFTSWSAIRGGHAGVDYRTFNDVSYNLFQVFTNDTGEEIYTTYKFHGSMHFLRMLSYPEPNWGLNDLIVDYFSNYSTVDIMDYGCGLAQQSRTFATYLKKKGIRTKLVLVDIPTIRKDFLLWLGKQTGIETSFLDSTVSTPMPNLPECDICFATEFFEHVYEPLPYFNLIHGVLRQNGILVTNVEDHKKEFLHVSPNLNVLRDKIESLNYEELQANRLFKKRAIG